MIVSAPLANNINPYMSYPMEIFTDILSEFGLLPVLTMIYQQTESAGWKSKNKIRDFEVNKKNHKYWGYDITFTSKLRWLQSRCEEAVVLNYIGIKRSYKDIPLI